MMNDNLTSQTLPSEYYKIKLPITLPITFYSAENIKSIKLPVSVTTDFEPRKYELKVPIKEQVSLTQVKMPVKETVWEFNGFFIEENLIEQLNTPLILLESVRSRILVNMELIGGNQIKLSWYGDAVPQVEIYKKMELGEEEFHKVATVDWAEGSYSLEIDSGSFEFLIKGINNTGESKVLCVGEPTYCYIDTLVDIPINEKIFDIDIDYTATYRIEVNY